MESALRQVRLIQIAMLAAIALYVVVGESVGRRLQPNPVLFCVLSFVSISVVGAILVARRTLISQSEAQLREEPGDATILGRWRGGYIVTYALCETLALLGLVLRMTGFVLAQVWPFYLGGCALMVFYAPRAPRAESK